MDGHISSPGGIFSGCGIELEYMIVSENDLSVMPLSDRIIERKSGAVSSEINSGELNWSNELTLHVIELKTDGPKGDMAAAAKIFAEQVKEINLYLSDMGGRLLGTGAHPFMGCKEARLWPHEYSLVYETYNRIFGCSDHGWVNVQSSHINLPFNGDEEFGILHDAVRVILPLLPALSASSPIIEGRVTGVLDSRLKFYTENQNRIPSIGGSVVPERVLTEAAYRTAILERMYKDIEPFDRERILCHEWLNSRGAIARFDRDAIEIRVLDMQENPSSDLALADFIIDAVKYMVTRNGYNRDAGAGCDEKALGKLLKKIAEAGMDYAVEDNGYAEVFGLTGSHTAGDIWTHLYNGISDCYGKRWYDGYIRMLLEKGPLSMRILKSCGDNPEYDDMLRVYKRLAESLERDEYYIPD